MVDAINNVGSGATSTVTTLLTGSFGQIVIGLIGVTLLGVIVGLVYKAVFKR